MKESVFELLDLKIWIVFKLPKYTDILFQLRPSAAQGLKSSKGELWFYINQFSSVAQSCPTLRPHESQHARPPCPHQLPEFTQTHVHRVSDAIQPSHPLSSPSPPAPNPSQPQSFPMSQLFAFNTLLTIIRNQSEGCKEKGFNTLNHLNLTDIHRRLYPTTEYTFLLSCI